MRLALRRRPPATSGTEAQVLEVITPRTNAATLTSSENFFASIASTEPFSVELAADSTRRRFFVRAGSQQMLSLIHI